MGRPVPQDVHIVRVVCIGMTSPGGILMLSSGLGKVARRLSRSSSLAPGMDGNLRAVHVRPAGKLRAHPDPEWRINACECLPAQKIPCVVVTGSGGLVLEPPAAPVHVLCLYMCTEVQMYRSTAAMIFVVLQAWCVPVSVSLCLELT